MLMLMFIVCSIVSSGPPVPRLTSVDWRVDYLLSSSFLAAADTTNVRMQLHIQPPTTSSSNLENNGAAEVAPPEQLITLALTPAQFALLYNDLKQAKQMLQH